MLQVVILTPTEQLFKGHAHHVILPGEQGVLEILPFHRPLVSRLLPGYVLVDNQAFPIRRGVFKVSRDELTAIVEPDDDAPHAS